jgi:tetratricopeptide (TPR) repeat protein
MGYLRRAVTLDPEFAQAHGLLAIGHVALTFFGTTPPHETAAKARGYASRALELGSETASPHMALAGVSHWYDFDHARAEEHFRMAMQKQPGRSGIYSWYAEFLVELQRFDEALQATKEAESREPGWLEVLTVRGNIHLYQGRPAEAIPWYLKALQLEPSHGLTRFSLGQALLAQGHPSDAVIEFRRASEATDDAPFARAALAYALALAGQRGEAEDLLAEFERRRTSGYYPAYALAKVHVGLGNYTAGLDWLDRAFEERLMGYYLPSVGQFWDPLRSHPRFANLLKRLGLPPGA